MVYYPVDTEQAIRRECLRRNYSSKTSKIYVYCVNKFLDWTGKKIDTVSKKDVSDYLDSGKTIDNLLNICHNTDEYIPSGVITRDEFNSWRGVNQYLWKLLLKQKHYKNKKYKEYSL